MGRVLVVDDNPQVRQNLCEALKRETDFDVCGEAENGREAIDKAKSLQPDLIVMDFSMPVLNGLEAVRLPKDLIRAQSPNLRFAHSMDYGLRGKLPTRPARAPSIRFLFIDSHLCSMLPSDLASRR